MKKSKKTPTEKDLMNIHGDINEILNLIDSLNEIDEDYDAKISRYFNVNVSNALGSTQLSSMCDLNDEVISIGTIDSNNYYYRPKVNGKTIIIPNELIDTKRRDLPWEESVIQKLKNKK